MALEIERKFLVINDNWKKNIIKTERMVQGYLGGNKQSSVRIRIYGEHADINIKANVIGSQRLEYEYPVSLADAEEMLKQLCDKPLIEKYRHHVEVGNHTWEVDEFEGENAGLIIAEIELDVIEESFDLPAWIGEEVTDDSRYYNIFLVSNPFSGWQKIN
ncbi:MAG: CYTH domain-containing protein [Chloroflexota bacterium]